MESKQIIENLFVKGLVFGIDVALFHYLFKAPWWAVLVGAWLASDIATIPDRVKRGT